MAIEPSPGYRQTLAHLRTCRDQLATARIPWDDGPAAWTFEQLGAVIAYSAAWRQMLAVCRDHAAHPRATGG